MIVPVKKLSTFLFSGIFVAVFLGTLPADVDARGGRGAGKAGGFKGKTRTSVGGKRASGLKKTSRPAKKSERKISNSGNRKKVDIDNSKRNINIDNSKDIDIDVDRHGGCCYGGGYYNHPIGTAVAVGVSAAIVGSIVYSLPSSCTTVIVGDVSYRQCGNSWYQPQYSGGSVSYIVIDNPN